jgi:hypothetical protein
MAAEHADTAKRHLALHLAQVNIGRMKAPLDNPSMRGFVSRLAGSTRSPTAATAAVVLWWVPLGSG